MFYCHYQQTVCVKISSTLRVKHNHWAACNDICLYNIPAYASKTVRIQEFPISNECIIAETGMGDAEKYLYFTTVRCIEIRKWLHVGVSIYNLSLVNIFSKGLTKFSFMFSNLQLILLFRCCCCIMFEEF